MNKDTIYRQAAIDKFEPWLKVQGYNEGELNILKAVLYELRSLPSAQPEYYDYSDIEDVWEFYAEEQDINLTDGAKQLKDAMWVGYRKGKQDAQPDLQEYSVWFRIGETLVDVSKMHITAEEGIEKIRSYLMRMKKPERKKGHWIRVAPRYYKCSECGVRANSSFANFCHRCGSDMR